MIPRDNLTNGTHHENTSVASKNITSVRYNIHAIQLNRICVCLDIHSIHPRGIFDP